MTTGTIAASAFGQMASRLESICNTDPHTIDTCAVNDCWWQGDLGVQFLGETLPESLSIKPTNNPQSQLAPGTNKGSRHVLANIGECEMHELQLSHPLAGPVIHAPSGVDVTHPEHGNITMREPGWYGIRYQKAHADELRRIED